jgi:hypothetical protein
MTGEFDPAKYHDTYTEDVKKLIEDKATGQKRQAPPKPARSNVIDIVAALQKSLAQKKRRESAALLDADQTRRHLSRAAFDIPKRAPHEWRHRGAVFWPSRLPQSCVGSMPRGSFTPPRRME